MKWRGSGCPVCRFTQDGVTKNNQGLDVDTNLNECTVCNSDVNLWICLICGHVGCGRYDAAHAFMHYKQTLHSFAMDLTNQRVWDYAIDGYVHRIMQDKIDGKLVELPSATGDYDNNINNDDFVPREKLDSIAQEYTHLLTSQLDSQRRYFEEKLKGAADKASEASQSAVQATEVSSKGQFQISQLQKSQQALETDIVPALQRERDRAAQKASRFEEMARKLEKQWREENTITKSLMERITFLDEEVAKLKEKNQDLAETNRDMSFFISGSQKLKEMELDEDITEGTVSLPEEKQGGGKKKKGKGKKKAKPKASDEMGENLAEGSGGKDEGNGETGGSKDTIAS